MSGPNPKPTPKGWVKTERGYFRTTTRSEAIQEYNRLWDLSHPKPKPKRTRAEGRP